MQSIEKIKLNKVGGPFLHSQAGHPWAIPRHVEWVNDGSAAISVYMDEAILGSISQQTLNFAWLVESSAIIPKVIFEIERNIKLLEKRYLAIFTHDRRLLSLSKKIVWVPQTAKPWVRPELPLRKIKNVSMIASSKIMCPGHYFRQSIINKFRGAVDHFGRGYTEIEAKEDGLRDYMFSIAMENDDYDVNVSEKITDCFAMGTIPIYWGSKSVCELFNAKGIIFLDDTFDLSHATREMYERNMDAVRENFVRATAFPLIEDLIVLNHIAPMLRAR